MKVLKLFKLIDNVLNKSYCLNHINHTKHINHTNYYNSCGCYECNNMKKENIKKLVNSKINFNVTDCEGDTYCHHKLKENIYYDSYIYTLIVNGAKIDLSVCDREGQSILRCLLNIYLEQIESGEKTFYIYYLHQILMKSDVKINDEDLNILHKLGEYWVEEHDDDDFLKFIEKYS